MDSVAISYPSSDGGLLLGQGDPRVGQHVGEPDQRQADQRDPGKRQSESGHRQRPGRAAEFLDTVVPGVLAAIPDVYCKLSGMVTEADLRLADYFQEKLNERFPDHHLFKYDQLNEKYSHEGKRYLWIFDPIEGVANYQAGIPIWGMSVALLDNFWPILGVFYMPATGDIFHARAGQDAFWGKKKIRRV